MQFEKILAAVQATEAWKTMQNTVENSPWHREANVAVHTLMTLAKYNENIAGHRTAKQQLITRICLTFHDFGKPEAEDEQTKEDGTTYRRYSGHELLSANSFIDFIMSHVDIRNMLFEAGITNGDLRAIRYMIEQHLPYGLVMQRKREILKMNLKMMLGENYVCFYDMLRSDSAGRISDDHEAKLQAVEEWIEKFDSEVQDLTPSEPVDDSRPTVIVLVGPSGAGKSTYTQKLLDQFKRDGEEAPEVFSLDVERAAYARSICDEIHLPWFDNYQATDPKGFSDMVYTVSDDADADFKSYAFSKYDAWLKAKKTIIVDNMHLSRKGTRGRVINSARQAGYRVEMVEFWVDINTITKRQHTRPDKFVPPRHVIYNYMRAQTCVRTSSYVDKRGKTQFLVEGEADMVHHIMVDPD